MKYSIYGEVRKVYYEATQFIPSQYNKILEDKTYLVKSYKRRDNYDLGYLKHPIPRITTIKNNIYLIENYSIIKYSHIKDFETDLLEFKNNEIIIKGEVYSVTSTQFDYDNNCIRINTDCVVENIYDDKKDLGRAMITYNQYKRDCEVAVELGLETLEDRERDVEERDRPSILTRLIQRIIK